MKSVLTSLQRMSVVALCAVVLLAMFGGAVSSVAAGQQSNDSAALSVDISSQSTHVSKGGSVSLTVTIRNSGEQNSPAPVFDLGPLPSGWNVSSWSNANASYRSTTNEWLWTELQASESKELTVELRASDTAEDLTVSGELTDGYNNTAVGDANLSIGAAPTSTPASTPVPSSGGGGGGGGQPTGPDPTSVRIIQTNDGLTVNVRDVSSSERFTANVSSVSENDIGPKSITFDFTFDAEDFRVEVSTPITEPRGTKAIPNATGISYFDLDAPGLEESKMDHARITVTVPEDELPDNVPPTNVMMYHYDGGNWEAIETKYLGDSQYAANTTSFSPFAVGYANGDPTATPSSRTTETSEHTPTAEPTTTVDDDPTDTSPSETTTESPGFGITVAVLTVIALTEIARRKEI